MEINREDRNLLFLVEEEAQTLQSHPMKGTPVLVPEPRTVMRIKIPGS
jgi:hypothetical protein